MSKDLSTTCGVRSKHVVIIIGIISIVQAVCYITIFATIYVQAKNFRITEHDGEWVVSKEFFAELISIGGLVTYTIKVLTSGILILGGLLSSPRCLVTFFIVGLLSVIFTVNLAVAGFHIVWTLPISIVITSFTVPDLVCIAIVLRACISMRRLKASGTVVRPPPSNQSYQLPSTSIGDRPSPPPYFAYFNTPSPVMTPQYTFPPPDINLQYMLPSTVLPQLYRVPGPETPSQLSVSALDMTARFTTELPESNQPYNIPTAYYSPYVQRAETENLQQSSNDVDNVSLDEPPRIYYTPVPLMQSFSHVSVENPLLRSKNDT